MNEIRSCRDAATKVCQRGKNEMPSGSLSASQHRDARYKVCPRVNFEDYEDFEIARITRISRITGLPRLRRSSCVFRIFVIKEKGCRF